MNIRQHRQLYSQIFLFYLFLLLHSIYPQDLIFAIATTPYLFIITKIIVNPIITIKREIVKINKI